MILKILLWAVTALIFICFLLSFIKEKRQFKNAILFFLTICFAFISTFFSLSNLKWIAYTVLFICTTMAIAAIMMVLATAWLIYRNGLTLTSVLPAGFAAIISFLIFITIIFGIGATENDFYIFLLLMSSFILLYLGVTFISYLFYSIFYSLIPKKNDYEFIIIHGARVFEKKPSKLLCHRIDKAIDLYYKGEKKVQIIASGGKGDDEDISEAQAIKEYLLSKGIPNDDIIEEDKSTTTMENLKFSKEFTDDKKCAFVTNNYHALRVSIFAKQLNMKGDAYGCKTALYYLPTGFIREYIAMLVIEKKSFLIYALLMLILSLITTLAI